MTTQTYFYRSNNHTINGLGANNLGTTNTTTNGNIATGNAWVAEHNVVADVHIRNFDGSIETALGTNIAQVELPHDGWFTSSPPWTPAAFALAPNGTDAIVVTEKIRRSPATVLDTRRWITTRLAQPGITANPWTFFRTINVISETGPEEGYPIAYHIYSWYGSASYPSRIEGVTFGEASAPPDAITSSDDFTVSLTESVEVNPTASITVSDAFTVSISEDAYLEGLSLKSGSDAITVALTETSAVEILGLEGLTNAMRDYYQALAIGESVVPFNNTNARIGVGDGTTAFLQTQTDLQGVSKFRKPMDAGYPQRSNNSLIFKSIFGSTEANFTWNEWGVFNDASGGVMMGRWVENLGTKSNGSTWAITATLTLSVE